MPPAARVALGSLLGAAVAACVAPFLKPLFSVPGHGVGFVTVQGYGKGWDYCVLALLVIGAFAGGMGFGVRDSGNGLSRENARTPIPAHRTPITFLVFVLMLFLHDHPHQHMDPFHEGEHLTPGFLLRDGARPYGD